MATTFQRLAQKIEKDTGLKCTNFRRTYAGVSMKASGAPVWIASEISSNMEVGSSYTATELLKGGSLVASKTNWWTFLGKEIEFK